MVSQAVWELLRKIFGSRFAEEYSELILICLAIIILLLIIWFVYKKRPELFMRSPKNKLPYEVGEDTIYGVDFREGLPMRFPVPIIGRRCVCFICRH